MNGLAMAAMLQVALLATSMNDYQTAYSQAEAGGKPLLVLVGNETSPDYCKLKQETLPELIRSGALEKLVLTEVDMAVKPNLARQMVRGDALPQLVLYTPVTKKTWRRRHIAGTPSEGEIQTFLVREISRGLEVAAERRKKSTATTATPVRHSTYTYSSGSS
jgi:hypothetical protein